MDVDYWEFYTAAAEGDVKKLRFLAKASGF
jgi:hypothetical protein